MTKTYNMSFFVCHPRNLLSGIFENDARKMKSYYVYIMASKKDGVLYVGMTNDIIRRVYEHRNNLIKGFTSTYFIHRLVYFEETDDVGVAIQREKQLKKWNRDWKIRLIEKENPEWNDLYDSIVHF